MKEMILQESLKKNASAIWLLYNERKGIELNTFKFYNYLLRRKFALDVINEIFLMILKWQPVNPWAYANLIGKKTTTIKEVNEIISEHEKRMRQHVDDTKSFFGQIQKFYESKSL